MGKRQSCEACRKRKTRCIRTATTCKNCDKHGLQCEFSYSTGDKGRLENVSPKFVAPMVAEDVRLESEPIEGLLIPPEYGSAMLAGPSSEQDPVLLQYYEKDQDGISSFLNHGVRQVDDSGETPVEFSLFRKPALANANSAVNRAGFRVLERVNPFSERLLALFFKFIDWSYPAVDKKAFYHAYYSEKSKLHLGLYAGMLALSTIYWKYDSQLCISAIPPNLATELWDLAAYFIEAESGYPSLETVQCQLIYLQRRLPRDDTSELVSTSSHLAKLVANVYTLGLNLDSTDWKISAHEKTLRNRLWAVTYVADKWTSCLLGRPSLLSRSQWTVPRFWTVFPEERLFLEINHLTEILDGVMESFYGARQRYGGTFNPGSVETLQSTALHLTRLEEWFDALPEDMRSMDAQQDGGFNRTGQLILCALTVKVLIMRVHLHPRNMSHPDFPFFRQRAAEVIQKIIRFTSEITHSHLHAFWLSTSGLAFSALAHFVFYYFVQSPPQERQEMSSAVRKWLWALRVLSNAWQEGTGLATLRMDSVFHMGETQVEIPYLASYAKSESTPEPSQHGAVQTNGYSNGTSNGGAEIFEDIYIGQHGGILNNDILPLDEQQRMYDTQEYHEVEYPQLLNNISMEDLIDDNLYDLLAQTLGHME